MATRNAYLHFGLPAPTSATADGNLSLDTEEEAEKS
tara:strand:- start:432 stop:539 length:108 start_codon:yes stop_codon:yes gene_type:complete